MNKTTHMRIAGYGSLIGFSQFLIFPTVAMFFYGGGTPLDHSMEGYTFWENFLSDLGRTVAYSGVENSISSPLFNSSLGLFGLSLILLYSAMFRLIPSILGWLTSLAGIASGIGMTIISLTPDDLYPVQHMFGVWLWGVALLGAVLMIIIHEIRTNSNRGIFLILSIFIVITLVIHIVQGLQDIRGPIVATTQKIVVYSNCIWYLILSRRMIDYSNQLE